LDAIDPTYIEATLRQIDLKKSCFIVISKSGGTTETITHTFLSKTLLEKEGITDLSKHFYVITDPQMSPLRRFAENHNIPVIDHDPDVGGRYAGLTAVGLLPALIAGLDAQKIIEGAYSTLEDISKIKGSEIVQSCALAYTLHTQGYQQAVLMVYQNALQPLSQWYRQMWAESLGKQGKGSTPITALGTVDQHSQLQLYLDGPRDKLFTLFLRNTSEQGALVNIDENLTKEFPQLEYLQGKTVGKIHHASGEATAMALRNQDLPVRLFRFDQLDEKLLGSLWMHIALETVLMAHLLEINAFDQPAVEEGKRLTRSLLTD
jgi:glucose-6-phosphate isomerase